MCVSIPLMVGEFMGFIVMDGVYGWYNTLPKPPFSPHPSIIKPIWTFLFTLMGVSFFFIYMSGDGPERRKALHLYFIQMALFVAGNIMFFRYEMLGWSMIEMYVAWIYIARMLFAFRYVHYLATIIQLPYMIVISFIQVIAASIWYQNNWIE
jgi:tryptophan-rich sensory protein